MKFAHFCFQGDSLAFSEVMIYARVREYCMSSRRWRMYRRPHHRSLEVTKADSQWSNLRIFGFSAIHSLWVRLWSMLVWQKSVWVPDGWENLIDHSKNPRLTIKNQICAFFSWMRLIRFEWGCDLCSRAWILDEFPTLKDRKNTSSSITWMNQGWPSKMKFAHFCFQRDSLG